MEKDEQFLHGYFVFVSQLCFDKAKEHVEKEKEQQSIYDTATWNALLHQLLQIALAEKSYMEIGFLQNKNKGFLRKDNSLQAVYDTINFDLKRIEELCKNNGCDKRVQNHCLNIEEFLSARSKLMHFYEQIFLCNTSKTKFNEFLQNIELLTQRSVLQFADISLTPMKAAFSLECAILEQLFRSLMELQRLQFLPSLAHIHGAHTRLQAWEATKIKNREVRKLGFIKTNYLPALFQWHLNFKAAVLSKFSLFFHDTLSSQTASNEMRQLCAKLQYDYYNKMQQFQKRYDAGAVLLLSDNQVSCDTTAYDCFPIIVSCPPRPSSQVDLILKMIMDVPAEVTSSDVIYKYSSQEKLTCIYSVVEPNIYLICLFDGKKTEKDAHISNFLNETCQNLRCTKVFASLKTLSK
ncbi:KICSTOR subunit 2-like [Atheta coriaria]|uniref:KICSTOR subunit 2-like n=1 Tax=Dalotia coriaria TaxID=877792 RepID=UPI0031F3F1C2